MIKAGEFSSGKIIQYENGIWTLMASQLVEAQNGSSFVRAKMKNIISGQVIEKSFHPDDCFEEAVIVRKVMQFLFRKGDFYYFMDVDSYQQIEIPAEKVGDALRFVKENETCRISSHQGNIFSIEGPMFAELKVTDTEEAAETQNAAGTAARTKPATVETGASVMVPLSVRKGDNIRIDTKNGEYLSRV